MQAPLLYLQAKMSLSTMMAITAAKDEGIALIRNDVPIPLPEQGQILLRIIYAGQNPPDVYALDKQRSSAYFDENFILGSDVSGIVIESKSQDVPIGAHVSAWIPGGTSSQGGYAEYVVCDATMVIRIPTYMSFRLAAALPFSFFTALHGLQIGLGLDMEPLTLQNISKTQKVKTSILIWGAGTACGYYACQISQLAGYEVIAVAGNKSKEQLKEVGISHFFSRDDPNQISKEIKQRWPNLYYALDCHASQESLNACIQSLRAVETNFDVEAKQYRIHALLPTQSSLIIPSNLKITFDLIHTMTGKPLPILSMIQPTHRVEKLERDHQLAVEWSRFDQGFLSKLLEQHQIKPLPVTVWKEDMISNVGIRERFESIKGILESVANGASIPSGKLVHQIGDI